MPQNHETIISIHLGLRSAESGKLSISPRLVYWLANVFPNGWSIAPHKRKTNLLEALTETLLFNYRDIKQEIVHTLLLEKYGVSKKWVITMDRRQDSNATSTRSRSLKGASWTEDRTQMRLRLRLRLQKEKVDLRLRIVTVPEV